MLLLFLLSLLVMAWQLPIAARLLLPRINKFNPGLLRRNFPNFQFKKLIRQRPQRLCWLPVEASNQNKQLCRVTHSSDMSRTGPSCSVCRCPVVDGGVGVDALSSWTLSAQRPTNVSPSVAHRLHFFAFKTRGLFLINYFKELRYNWRFAESRTNARTVKNEEFVKLLIWRGARSSTASPWKVTRSLLKGKKSFFPVLPG